MADSKLATLLVEIKAAGLEVLSAALEKTQTGLSTLGTAANAMGTALATALANAAGKAQGAFAIIEAQAGKEASAFDKATAAAVAFGQSVTSWLGMPAALARIGTAAAATGTAAANAGAVMASGLAKAAGFIPGLSSALVGLGAVWQGLGLHKSPFDLKEIQHSAAGMAGMFTGVSQAAVGLNTALGPVISRLTGFVQSGFMASGAGELFNLRMEQLSHQIASLFAPQLEALVNWLGEVVRWFQSLDGEQQAQIARWVMLAGGIAAAAIILPQVIASVQALGVAFGGLQAVMAAMSISNPWILALTVFGAIVAMCLKWETILKGIAGLGKLIGGIFSTWAGIFNWIGTNLGLIDEKTKGKTRTSLATRGGDFEAIDATWRRMAKSSMKMGEAPTTEQIKALLEERVLVELQGIRVATENPRGAVVR